MTDSPLLYSIDHYDGQRRGEGGRQQDRRFTFLYTLTRKVNGKVVYSSSIQTFDI